MPDRVHIINIPKRISQLLLGVDLQVMLRDPDHGLNLESFSVLFDVTGILYFV